MIARRAATLLLAGALVVGVSGCTFFAQQATRIEYAPSDGSQATLGSVKALNVIAITEDGEDVSLIGTITNTGAQTATVNLQLDGDKEFTEKVVVPAYSSVSLGINDGEQLIFRGVNASLGGLIDVYIQWGTEEGVEMRVPVLPPDFEYTGLEPGEKPTPTLTPDPMATLPVEGED